MSSLQQTHSTLYSLELVRKKGSTVCSLFLKNLHLLSNLGDMFNLAVSTWKFFVYTLQLRKNQSRPLLFFSSLFQILTARNCK